METLSERKVRLFEELEELLVGVETADILLMLNNWMSGDELEQFVEFVEEEL